MHGVGLVTSRFGYEMIKAYESELLKKSIRKIWRIWFGIFYCLAIYIYICHKYPDIFGIKVGKQFPIEVFKYILYAVTAIESYLVHFTRKKVLSVEPSDALADLDKIAHDANPESIIRKYTCAVIVSIAIAESFAIYGFVLFLFGADYKTLYIFVGIAAVAMLLYRPKMRELEEYYRLLQTESPTSG
jgi:hypothetical protein